MQDPARLHTAGNTLAEITPEVAAQRGAALERFAAIRKRGQEQIVETLHAFRETRNIQRNINGQPTEQQLAEDLSRTH